MNYATIKTYDVANGPGIRVSLFVSGCEHFCKGCFNSEAWNFSYGKEYSHEVHESLIDSINKRYINGLSILGGEPMHPRNQSQILDIVSDFSYRYKYANKDLWMYTGYLFEDILSGKVGELSKEILKHIDVLVDGPFIEDQKDIGLNFRGSSNQRIIDVKKSLSEGKVILHPLGIGDSNRYRKDRSND